MTLITIINKNLYELVPIIFEFKEKITKHLLIYDSDNKDKIVAKQLKKSIIKINNFYQLSQKVELIEIDEDSKADMLFVQNRLKNEHLDTLYLNATNSDISLVVVLSGFILNNHGKVIAYDKYDNTYNIIDTTSFYNHTIKNVMKIEDFLILLNYELISETRQENILLQKESLIYLFHDFNKLFKIRKLLSIKKVTILKEEFPDYLSHLKRLDILDENSILIPISYFGVLFEQFIFLHLIRYDFDDMKIGAEIAFKTVVKNDAKSNVLNEFDVLAIKDNHIYTIECKLGNNIDSQNIIYKSDSLLGYFGDDSKNLIINIHKDKPKFNSSHSTNNKVFKDLALFRANSNNIEVYNEFQFKKKQFSNQITQFFNIQERVFLIGGKDLEMATIKNLLKFYNQIIFDKELSWGAKLSDYEEKLKKSYHFYGIELIKDIKVLEPYTTIDHHNELQNRDSSLSQIAKIFSKKLTRYETLVSLNDSGYIPSLKEYGAKKEEIEEIRQKDRLLQGVLQEDEILAIKSIEKMQTVDDIIIINSLTDKFSAVVDRLYDKNLIVFTDTKLNYYGRDCKKIITKYQHLIDDNSAYYGGNFGFFGIADNFFKKKKIKKIKDEIILLLKK